MTIFLTHNGTLIPLVLSQTWNIFADKIVQQNKDKENSRKNKFFWNEIFPLCDFLLQTCVKDLMNNKEVTVE